jgi:hypothetical protein
MVEEDSTWDSETGHTTEAVDYLAIQGDGTLTADAYAESGEVVTTYYYPEAQQNGRGH